MFSDITRTLPDSSLSYYSLPALGKKLHIDLSHLPHSIRIMLESLARNCDDKKVRTEDVLKLANWDPKNLQSDDIPFVVSRVLLQDFTGVPLLVDLAAMRDAAVKQGRDPKIIEPVVPVDLVVDHSVQVDRSGTPDAFLFNLELEFQRNQERYAFLRWGQEAFQTFNVIPPGIGIVHQVNLEHLAHIVTQKGSLAFFDTLVGTDSHTTMVGGLGVLGWGVGGIEAEAAMLGQPYFLQTPEVVGMHLSNKLQEGITATDLTLYITELLRKEKVVGKIVEFFGEGASALSVADRATISNMAPEYGATTGFFAVDEKTLAYLKQTGRSKEHVELVHKYCVAQELFGIPKKGTIHFSKVVELDLSTIRPCVCGPKRPQDRLNLADLKAHFHHLLQTPKEQGGYGKSQDNSISLDLPGHFHPYEPHITGGTSFLGTEASSFSESEMVTNRPITQGMINPGYTQHLSSHSRLQHGSIVIAAITSCTNTSNPNVMIAAGLLAKKAVEKGLKVSPHVKASLAPGSRAVTDYLQKSGLQPFLDKLGFQLVAYGCTTCIGNSGPLDEEIERCIKEYDLISASVLSGNRNFEARIHAAVKANFLMSPPLVIAFALCGNILTDLTKEPLGYTPEKEPVFLKDLWPSNEEIADVLKEALCPKIFQKQYADLSTGNPFWEKIPTKQGKTYTWAKSSTYIQSPPFFEHFALKPQEKKPLHNMRVLALLGDSVTTDHISPAGAFGATSAAGKYLISQGIEEDLFNSYGSRRGNHLVMMRGTFANVRLRNKMVESEGGSTLLLPEKKQMSIFDACQIYAERNVPLILFAGKDYGMGSSRDWAAKGTALLGVQVVVAKSFERIHRSNLIGMGVLPLQFLEEDSWESWNITGQEEFSLTELPSTPQQQVILKTSSKEIPLLCRLDTPTDLEYYRHGGILPYVLRLLL